MSEERVTRLLAERCPHGTDDHPGHAWFNSVEAAYKDDSDNALACHCGENLTVSDVRAMVDMLTEVIDE